MATKEAVIKKYEELSGRKGEFEVRQGVDVNGVKTFQVWNKVSNSLVAEVDEGREDDLLADPQAPSSVDHLNEDEGVTIMKDGRVVGHGEDEAAAKKDAGMSPSKPAEDNGPSDAEKKEAKEKAAAEKKAKAEQEKADKEAQALAQKRADEEAAANEKAKADAEKKRIEDEAAKQNGGN